LHLSIHSSGHHRSNYSSRDDDQQARRSSSGEGDGRMSGGESGPAAAAAAVPLLQAPEGRTTKYYEGCPGCRLDEANKTRTGVPYLNFFYIWVVCLAAGTYTSAPPRCTRACCTACRYGLRAGLIRRYGISVCMVKQPTRIDRLWTLRATSPSSVKNQTKR
jgi:hypothetical protein